MFFRFLSREAARLTSLQAWSSLPISVWRSDLSVSGTGLSGWLSTTALQCSSALLSLCRLRFSRQLEAFSCGSGFAARELPTFVQAWIMISSPLISRPHLSDVEWPGIRGVLSNDKAFSSCTDHQHPSPSMSRCRRHFQHRSWCLMSDWMLSHQRGLRGNDRSPDNCRVLPQLFQ